MRISLAVALRGVAASSSFSCVLSTGLSMVETPARRGHEPDAPFLYEDRLGREDRLGPTLGLEPYEAGLDTGEITYGHHRAGSQEELTTVDSATSPVSRAYIVQIVDYML